MELASKRQKNCLKFSVQFLSEEEYAYIEDRMTRGEASDLITTLKSIPPGHQEELMQTFRTMLKIYANRV